MAPEMLAGQADYSTPVDIYSFSLILYQMIFGENSFFQEGRQTESTVPILHYITLHYTTLHYCIALQCYPALPHTTLITSDNIVLTIHYRNFGILSRRHWWCAASAL